MLIPLIAYAGDCRVSGDVELDAERLSDMLNAQEEILVRDAVLESLDDRRLVAVEELILRRDELYAVEALDPGGLEARRTHAVQHRLKFKLGPYTIVGSFHARPGAPALAVFAHRGPIVPLTEAAVAYTSGGRFRTDTAKTLLVNRELADWVREATDADTAPALLAGPGGELDE